MATTSTGLLSSFVSLACVLLIFPLAEASTNGAEGTSSPPDWQTVFPDTQIVVPLFGSEGPPWRLFYRDPTGSDTTSADNESWNGNYTAQVPGDVVSDLLHNRIIQDPYVDLNLWEESDMWLGPQQQDNTASNDDKPPKSCQKKQTRIWKYSTEVDLSQYHDNNNNLSWRLVVESLQMGATISWNGVFVANITDQFLRYSLPLDITETHLQTGHHDHLHTLSVTFDPSIETNGRFMACAGGWDWAPYTLACDDQERRIFTRGIVQPIYLVVVDQFAISHVVPKVYYQGTALPRTPMKQPDADFRVQLEVHLDFAKTNRGHGVLQKNKYQVAATSDFATDQQTQTVVSSNKPIMVFNMTAPKDQIQLWWPNGMGSQPLYHVKVAILPSKEPRAGVAPIASREAQRLLMSDASDAMWIEKRIGFRTSAIVTINETALDEYVDIKGGDSKWYDNNLREEDEEQGTGMHGMYMRINGALVMARGANIIPNDQLVGRYVKNANDQQPNSNEIAYEIIVQSAAAANMNMIRVWGGGKVLPQHFYDACDEMGIMLYQDQMFVDEDHHGPFQTPTIRQEIQHMVRSLAFHTSIVVWNGCNECQVVMGTSSEIYATFVLQTVGEEDDTRSIWPSSPSKYGWETGVNRYDSKPNGEPLSTRNPSNHKGEPVLESHGPYMRAFSKDYVSVNGVDQHFPYPNKPNKLNQGDIGPQNPNCFASEFGASVWSSFESISGTIATANWGIHGNSPPDKCYNFKAMENVCEGTNVMAQRNYPCDTHIEAYFGNWTSLNDVGEFALQGQLYHCMMAQTLWMKDNIELRRSTNTFGLLIWQLNENWPTGGWGLIEYSADPQQIAFPGQVLGGRWKALMHLLRNFLFRDVFVACGRNNICFLRNDGMQSVDAVVTLEAWNIASSGNGSPPTKSTFQATLEGGVSSTVRFQAPKNWDPDHYDAMILSVSDAKSGSILMEDSVFLWQPLPKLISNLRLKVDIAVHSIEPGCDAFTAIVKMSSNRLALYVLLTTRAPGRFEENAFVLRPGEPKHVTFVTMKKGSAVDIALLKQSLRVEHLGRYA